MKDKCRKCSCKLPVNQLWHFFVCVFEVLVSQPLNSMSKIENSFRFIFNFELKSWDPYSKYQYINLNEKKIIIISETNSMPWLRFSSFYFHFISPLLVNPAPRSLTQHSRNVTRLENIALCVFPWLAPDLLSGDKLLSYLSSLRNSFQTAHLNSPARPSGGSFPPPAWHESFLWPPLWPPSAQAGYALNPARRVNLPALIKIASFVAPFLPLSSCPLMT